MAHPSSNIKTSSATAIPHKSTIRTRSQSVHQPQVQVQPKPFNRTASAGPNAKRVPFQDHNAVTANMMDAEADDEDEILLSPKRRAASPASLVSPIKPPSSNGTKRGRSEVPKTIDQNTPTLLFDTQSPIARLQMPNPVTESPPRKRHKTFISPTRDNPSLPDLPQRPIDSLPNLDLVALSSAKRPRIQSTPVQTIRTKTRYQIFGKESPLTPLPHSLAPSLLPRGEEIEDEDEDFAMDTTFEHTHPEASEPTPNFIPDPIPSPARSVRKFLDNEHRSSDTDLAIETGGLNISPRVEISHSSMRAGSTPKPRAEPDPMPRPLIPSSSMSSIEASEEDSTTKPEPQPRRPSSSMSSLTELSTTSGEEITTAAPVAPPSTTATAAVAKPSVVPQSQFLFSTPKRLPSLELPTAFDSPLTPIPPTPAPAPKQSFQPARGKTTAKPASKIQKMRPKKSSVGQSSLRQSTLFDFAKPGQSSSSQSKDAPSSSTSTSTVKPASTTTDPMPEAGPSTIPITSSPTKSRIPLPTAQTPRASMLPRPASTLFAPTPSPTKAKRGASLATGKPVVGPKLGAVERRTSTRTSTAQAKTTTTAVPSKKPPFVVGKPDNNLFKAPLPPAPKPRAASPVKSTPVPIPTPKEYEERAGETSEALGRLGKALEKLSAPRPVRPSSAMSMTGSSATSTNTTASTSGSGSSGTATTNTSRQSVDLGVEGSAAMDVDVNVKTRPSTSLGFAPAAKPTAADGQGKPASKPNSSGPGLGKMGLPLRRPGMGVGRLATGGLEAIVGSPSKPVRASTTGQESFTPRRKDKSPKKDVEGEDGEDDGAGDITANMTVDEILMKIDGITPQKPAANTTPATIAAATPDGGSSSTASTSSTPSYPRVGFKDSIRASEASRALSTTLSQQQLAQEEKRLAKEKEKQKASEEGRLVHRSESSRPMRLRQRAVTAPVQNDADAEGKKAGPSKPVSLNVLKSCVIFVDVRTEVGEDAGTLFVDMLKGLGARTVTKPTKQCTHIVYKSGCEKTVMRWRCLDEPRPKVVGIGWVVECVEKRERVDEERFSVNLEEVASGGSAGKRRRSLLPKQLHGISLPASAFPMDVDGSDTNGSQGSDVLSFNGEELTPLEMARKMSMNIART